MKKIILGLCFLLFISAAFSQTGKLRVAVSFDMDTNFTLLGPLSTKSLEIDLTGTMYQQIVMLMDTNSFQLVREAFPEELSAANNPALTGIPRVSDLQKWVNKLRKNASYDLLLIIYKPLKLSGKYGSLEGLSYGLNTTKGIVFSLNNALVFDMKTMKLLAATTIDSESDFIAGTFTIDKSLPNDDSKNIVEPIEMINKLNQDFALKVFQCLQASKKKLTQK